MLTSCRRPPPGSPLGPQNPAQSRAYSRCSRGARQTKATSVLASQHLHFSMTSGPRLPLHTVPLGDHGPPSLRPLVMVSWRPRGQLPILSPSGSTQLGFQDGSAGSVLPRTPPSAPRLSLTGRSDAPRAAESACGSSGRRRAACHAGRRARGTACSVPTTRDIDCPGRKGPCLRPTSCRAPRACSLPLLLRDPAGRPGPSGSGPWSLPSRGSSACTETPSET